MIEDYYWLAIFRALMRLEYSKLKIGLRQPPAVLAFGSRCQTTPNDACGWRQSRKPRKQRRG